MGIAEYLEGELETKVSFQLVIKVSGGNIFHSGRQGIVFCVLSYRVYGYISGNPVILVGPVFEKACIIKG